MDTTTDAQQSGNNSIVQALDQLDDVVRNRPELLRETYRSVTKLVNGLQCETQEDTWRATSDLPETVGGQGAGPSPGMLGRAALGSCLTMGYVLHATRLGVELTSLTVTVEADSDDGGMLSLDSEARPGYSEVRYHVDIVSPASDELVHKVLDEGDLLSPYRDVFSEKTPMKRTSSISQTVLDGRVGERRLR